MRNLSLSTRERNAIKIVVPVVLAIFVSPAAIFFPPVMIVTGFLIFQCALRMLFLDEEGVSFKERLFTAPVKFIVATWMTNAGMPTDNVLSVIWVSAVILFLYSGSKDLYVILRTEKDETPSSFVGVRTFAQNKKTTRTEERLLAELSDFLNKDEN